MIALAVLRWQDIVAKTELVSQRLALKMECVEGRCITWREKRDGIAAAFRFEELPHRANFHEKCSFLLHLFHVFVQFERAWISFRQGLFEISAEAQMSPEQHVGIDVTPNLVQIRYRANFPVQICNRRDGQIRADARRTLLAGRLQWGGSWFIEDPRGVCRRGAFA